MQILALNIIFFLPFANPVWSKILEIDYTIKAYNLTCKQYKIFN